MIFYFICIPNNCQKVDLNLTVLNNALVRNFFLFFAKNVSFLHIPSVQVSDDFSHNFYDSFRTKQLI